MQATLERAIATVTGEAATVDGAGRTDAGAHACRQVIAFPTESTLPVDALLRGLNATLPADIAVVSATDVDPAFHPRHDARARAYRYLIWNRPVRSPFWHGRAAHIRRPLDERRMDEALQLLVGRVDVGAFVPSSLDGNREREVFFASCCRAGDLVTVEICATGFLRQMVRAIAGTLIQVGAGTLDLPGFAAIVAGRDRTAAGDTAPAGGLYLVDVQYDADHVRAHAASRPLDTTALSIPEEMK